ncbi:MAG: glycerol acyltransferase [Bacteroidetes bacterium GWA2_30_7]|nr:MAG: glycerol acyltransferase [Bacteroidetes bacterium GWA2_30_7]
MNDLTKKNSELLIDIDGVLKSKNPKLYNLIPRFFIKYLKRIIHQDAINEFVKKNSDKFGLDFIDAIVKEFNVKVKIKNEENIPVAGRYIFVANHPLGALESMVLMQAVSKYHKTFKFIVNDILMYLKNLSSVFVPVNKHGSNSKEYFKILDETFNSDSQVLIFPAGLVSRKINGKIQDLEWKKSFITMSQKYKRDIVPVYISARNSNFFYNFAYIRKILGIKANIEMIYLPDELYKQYNKEIGLTFGKPISYLTFDRTKRSQEWAEWTRNKVYSLQDN